MNNKKSKYFFSLLVHLFSAFTLVIFGPYEIFISNTNDFSFTFRDFWWIPLSAAVLYIMTATIICTLLPSIFGNILNCFAFSFTLCCYIQAMFLNGKMQVMLNQEIRWNTSTILVNIIIWICIFVIIFLLPFWFKQSWKKIIAFASSALIAIQLSALIFLFITTNALTEEKNGYLSQDGMLELSPNENVIVFVLDTFDIRTMDRILGEDPDFLSPLTGFTYFPNATSTHSRTYPSVTYLLTGNMCYFDQTPVDYVNNAFADSNFLPTLYNNQIDIGLYTFDYYIGNSVKTKIRNYVPLSFSLKYKRTIRYLLQIALYRDMPYAVKPYFYYDVNDINNNIVDESNFQSAANEDSAIPAYKNFDDEWFYDSLTTNKLSLSNQESSFRFYHLASCHLNLSDMAPYGKRSIEIIYDYLDQMKALNIYENSTIIITTDHGWSGGQGDLDLPQATAAALTIVKPSGTLNEELTISEAPVAHTDFIPTVLNGFSLDYSDYGNTVFDIPNSAERDRYYYYSALYSDEEGEVELREYKVSGDARIDSSYHFTGNKWEIFYSLNKVAPK
ncbi:MAG: hypothetical protein NC429_02245 [Lachnospiraceae bacterium]|nr:hypothetical protein [Lachnospiraceae bacterium]